MRRIGIYPGTFDPIHLGHLAFAGEAMRVCKLDRVILLPEQQPRGKHNVTSMTHRLVLIEQAIQTQPNIRVISATSKQFTVRETLPELQALFTQATLYLLIGSDVARNLHTWGELGLLLREVSLLIAIREGDDQSEIIAVMHRLQKQLAISFEYRCIQTAHSNVASSHIRQVATDMSQLHPTMHQYIKDHGLYSSLDRVV